jgi:hypothetical protein
MRLIDKIAYISFWLSIIFLLFVLIGMPILFMSDFLTVEYISYKNGLNPVNFTFSFLNTVAVFHWGYCIWFLFKYDRYSKSVFPLFFLSVWYAPIYYYRVKIKKRPLRNKAIKPVEPITEDYSISDSEFIELTRNSIIQILHLWASKADQLELQKLLSKDEITPELFNYWSDYSMADSEVISESFNSKEIDLLSEFDMHISNIENKYNGQFPDIEEFQKTPDWDFLNQLAKEISRTLNE